MMGWRSGTLRVQGGLRRVYVSKELFASILRGVAGDCVSNLPEDVEVVTVYEHPDDIERGREVFTVIVASSDWPSHPVGMRIPEFLLIMTRVGPNATECSICRRIHGPEIRHECE
jgi:hypothetical protein